MGTACYYAKIWYEEKKDSTNEELLIGKAQQLKALIAEGIKAHDLLHKDGMSTLE